MAVEIKTEIQIPDLWYDFYARFLPGSIFVYAIRLFIIGTPYTSIPSVPEMIVIAFAAFLTGLFTQPFSSRIILEIHSRAERRNKVDEGFVKQVQHELGIESNESKILSKMHGEVAFFMQLAILNAIFIALIITKKPEWYYFIFLLLPLLLSLLSTFMVADRRVVRAKKDKAILDKFKSEGVKIPPPETYECKIEGRITLANPNAGKPTNG